MLATTAVCVPLCGFLPAIFGIAASFKACPCGTRFDMMLRIMDGLGDGLVPLTFALGTGIVARIVHSALERRAAAMNLEMETIAD